MSSPQTRSEHLVREVPDARSRVAWWRACLDRGSAHVSGRYRDRYAVVLAGLEGHAPPPAVSDAMATAGPQPWLAARILAGAGWSLPRERAAPERYHITGDPVVGAAISELLRRTPTVRDALRANGPLLQTTVPIHPSRDARLLRGPGLPDAGLVAVLWDEQSVPTRLANAEALRPVAAGASDRAPLEIGIQADVALVEVAGQSTRWAVASNLGTTLEDRLRYDGLGDADRSRILATLRAFRNAMLDAGLVWQGFAPRNMFLSDERITLIDFEELVPLRRDPARAAECLLWHRVFFADCLTATEAAWLREGMNHIPAFDTSAAVTADPFERAISGSATISWETRRSLLEATCALEGCHRRPTDARHGGRLHGHELGHFWGDFLPAEDEARLFQVLQQVSGTALTACLECFEAAMEADLCQWLRDAAFDDEAVPSTRRTEALIDVVDHFSPEAAVVARAGREDWYARLRTNPSSLVDDVLFDARGAPAARLPNGFDPLLVGSPGWREQHEAALRDVVAVGMDFVHRFGRGEPFLDYRSADKLREEISLPVPQKGTTFDETLREVERLLVDRSIAQGHPRYVAFPDSGNAVAAMAGSLLAPLLNQNLIAVDRSAPAATFAELQVVEWLRELIGFDAAPVCRLRGVRDAAGLWTTGGHLSNHVAMLAALGSRFPEVRTAGLTTLESRPMVVLAGPIAHYSHSDAAFHLGLGWGSVVAVGTEANHRTDPDAVDAVLSQPRRGETPFMVVGVAGNCRTTGLDDLRRLSDVCRRHGAWFHVDACHGGSLIFHDRLRRTHLDGIELADSVSLDPHKGLFTPYPSSYVVFRERGRLTQFSRHTSAVLEGDNWDLGLVTPFLGSRGFHSLATWMLMRHAGVEGLAAMVEVRQRLVRHLEARIVASGLFTPINAVDFYRFTFVLCPEPLRTWLRSRPEADRERATAMINAYSSRLNAQLYRSGAACFDEHTLADCDDRVGVGAGTRFNVLAACPGNPLVTREELDAVVAELVAVARPLASELVGRLISGQSSPSGARMSPLGSPAGWSDR